MIHKQLNRYKSLPIQIKAAFWFVICGFLQRGIALITTPIFTRIMTEAEFGQYSVFISWEQIISVVVTLNLSSGLYIRGLVQREYDLRNKFASSMQGLCLTLVSVWLVVYWLAHDFWNRLFSMSTEMIVLMLLLIWLQAVFSFWSQQQKVEVNYKGVVVVSLLVAFVAPSLGIVFIRYMPNPVLARIIGQVLPIFFVYSGIFVIQMCKGKTFFDIHVWKQALYLNIPLIPHYLSNVILSSADRIMISKMVNEDAAGIYSLAYSVSLIFTVFNTALLQVIEPWLHKRIKQNRIEDIAKVAYSTFIIVASVNCALIAFAPEIITIFAPKSYMDAIWVIPPVAISVFLMFAYMFFSVFEFYYAKVVFIAISTAASAILNIVLNYIFIGIFGYIAAGYTTLFCYLVYVVFHYQFSKRICKEKHNGAIAYNSKVIILITSTFITISAVFLSTYKLPALRYAMCGAISVALFIKRRLIINSIKKIISLKSES